MEGTATAFMWDGNYPREFVLGEQFTIGTGAGVLWPFLKDRALHTPPPSGLSPMEHASIQTLTLTGNLMKSDLSDRIQQNQHGFGVGYDILIWDSGRFRYLSPIVYAAMSAQVDGNGRVGEVSRLWGVALLRNVGEYTLCQIGRSWACPWGWFRPLRDQRLQEPALSGFRFEPNTRGEFRAWSG